ncbi:MAG: glycogen synthase GlgA [Clostridiales bacterium]|nr:glycogen synthase GlgA [Clostridiales bacterium]
MGDKTKVLFAAFEATPFIKTGGLGDVAGSLPAYIKNDCYDARVILPLLNTIPEEYRNKMRYVDNYMVPLGWRSQYCGLFKLRKGNVTYYFLDNEYYFKRGSVYGEFDDGERVAFFSAAVLETIKHIAKNFAPDILHCNDWHTALVPVFLRELYRGDELYDRIKTVFTIHNLKFQGQYDKYMVGDVLGLQTTPAAGQMNHNDNVNFLQGAVIYSDAVTTVSPTYADEICSVQYGEGLEGLFTSRKYKLYGIINGIDRKSFDPKTDKNIFTNYSRNSMNKKVENKLALQRELGLKEDPDVPLFAMVSRLTHQKGANLIAELLPEFAERNMQVAVLGTGDYKYENAIGEFAYKNPENFAARITFNESLSRRFYAGSDVFLMPSEFEPCGLSQMISMRYGSLPLVRETGGLKDTVNGYWDAGEKADGFSFRDFDKSGLRNAVDLALSLWFDNKDMWQKLMTNAMGRHFGWEESAEEYRKLYDKLLGR